MLLYDLLDVSDPTTHMAFLVPTQSPDAEFLSQLEWQEIDRGEGSRARFRHDGVYYQIEVRSDDDFDYATEWLGKYTDTDDVDLIGDRKNGVLYGAWEDHTRKFTDELEAERLYKELRQDNAVRKIDDEYIDQDDDDLWEVSWSERKILSEEGPNNYGGTRTFEFWKPVEDRTPDVLAEEDIAVLVQDWNRMERYGEDWITTHINADIYRDPDDWAGEPIGSASVGGVERQIGYGDDNTAFYDTLSEIVHEAADGILVERQPPREEEWPNELALFSYLFTWLNRFCNFVGVIDPASIEASSAIPIEQRDPSMTIHIANVQIVCNTPIRQLQRLIHERLIPELESWSMTAFTEIDPDIMDDGLHLTLVVTDFSGGRTRRYILRMHVLEAGAILDGAAVPAPPEL